jgi:hypothetical protein
METPALFGSVLIALQNIANRFQVPERCKRQPQAHKNDWSESMALYDWMDILVVVYGCAPTLANAALLSVRGVWRWTVAFRVFNACTLVISVD